MGKSTQKAEKSLIIGCGSLLFKQEIQIVYNCQTKSKILGSLLYNCLEQLDQLEQHTR